MQETIIGNATRHRRYLPERIPEKTNRSGDHKREKETGRVRKSNSGFLTTVFKPIPVGEFNPLYSEENYKLFYDSIVNYAGLLGIECNIDFNPMEWEMPFNLLNRALPPKQEFRLQVADDGESLLHQIIDETWDDSIFYHIPCQIIDRTEGLFNEILVLFFSLLHGTQGFVKITDCWYLEYLRENIECTPKRELDKGWVDEVKQYLKRGSISKTMNRIKPLKAKSKINRLEELLSGFIPNNRREENMQKLISESVDLFRENRNIIYCNMTPDVDQDYYYSMNIDNTLQIVYADDDVYESYASYLNGCAQESGFDFITPGYMAITPDTREILTQDKYVMDFMKWLNRLQDELNYA